MANDDGRMRAGSGGRIDHTIDEQAVSGDVDHGHLGRMRFVGGRIGEYGWGNGLSGGSESRDD